MVSENQEPYVLVQEEKNNVEEVEAYLETLKTVESIKKEYNFQQVFAQVLAENKYSANEVEVLEITPVSQEKYIFIIYHITLRCRFRIVGWYSSQEKKVVIQEVEKVFSEELKDIKVPEEPEVRIITKESITKNVEAKEVFDYLYKVQPTFRQVNVENIKIEESQGIKKAFVVTKKEGKDYRYVVLKEKQTQEVQLIDEGFVVFEKPTATIVTENSDHTKTITTNKIDVTTTEVKTVIKTLEQNHISSTESHIESLQTTEGPKSIEYVVVLADAHGHPTKQVTINEDKATKVTSVVDYTTLESEIKYTKIVKPEVTVIPTTEYYNPEIKELVSKVETKSQGIVFSKINKIEVSETSEAKKYSFIVKDSHGEVVKV